MITLEMVKVLWTEVRAIVGETTGTVPQPSTAFKATRSRGSVASRLSSFNHATTDQRHLRASRTAGGDVSDTIASTAGPEGKTTSKRIDTSPSALTSGSSAMDPLALLTDMRKAEITVQTGAIARSGGTGNATAERRNTSPR